MAAVREALGAVECDECPEPSIRRGHVEEALMAVTPLAVSARLGR
jgi:hypothetical protein